MGNGLDQVSRGQGGKGMWDGARTRAVMMGDGGARMCRGGALARRTPRERTDPSLRMQRKILLRVGVGGRMRACQQGGRRRGGEREGGRCVATSLRSFDSPPVSDPPLPRICHRGAGPPALPGCGWRRSCEPPPLCPAVRLVCQPGGAEFWTFAHQRRSVRHLACAPASVWHAVWPAFTVDSLAPHFLRTDPSPPRDARRSHPLLPLCALCDTNFTLRHRRCPFHLLLTFDICASHTSSCNTLRIRSRHRHRDTLHTSAHLPLLACDR